MGISTVHAYTSKIKFRIHVYMYIKICSISTKSQNIIPTNFSSYTVYYHYYYYYTCCMHYAKAF